jgi:hypothetical protein
VAADADAACAPTAAAQARVNADASDTILSLFLLRMASVIGHLFPLAIDRVLPCRKQ